jgi:hypothetical protein
VENTNTTYNRLRTVFVVNKAHNLMDDDGNVIHMADSKFVLKLLSQITELKELRKGYKYAVTKLTGSAAAKGNVKEIKVTYGEGDHKASIEALKEKGNIGFLNFPLSSTLMLRLC